MPAMAIASVMTVNLYDHQKQTVDKLESGSILCGGVGSGKSLTAVAYYYYKECLGTKTHLQNPMDLYIITTAKKRDSMEWDKECSHFTLSKHRDGSVSNVKVHIDSWNNIKKYVKVENAFFIFDEQRLVGSGVWVKSFLKIVKHNHWVLLSATPGDTWTDYIPVFVANGFYKNRTEFLARHAVFNRFSKYPKIDRFVEEGRLIRLRDKITVTMHYQKNTRAHQKVVMVEYDKNDYETLFDKRWNIFKNRPVKTAGELCYLLRKVVNSDPSRVAAMKDIFAKHKKLIVFYNFDYELELLRNLCKKININFAEWNGHNHEEVPTTDEWMYLVQYSAGAEGWNCIETDTIVFYSQNYSYKIMVQAAGRIDRLNTKFVDLNYYHIRSKASIDLAIDRALKKKKNFNILKFAV